MHQCLLIIHCQLPSPTLVPQTCVLLSAEAGPRKTLCWKRTMRRAPVQGKAIISMLTAVKKKDTQRYPRTEEGRIESERIESELVKLAYDRGIDSMEIWLLASYPNSYLGKEVLGAAT